ncbi:hypothetical protein G3480_19860 [Thiorhodococcus mannitoliphagus]|uniref:ATP-grasp domain-containing protein n=1 Tax=Thiorhodococcus mannitoliphagus TaxID=329406 RepID=A0A6P1E0G7_9GAMM|nr:hypothetical protein [Thiorhodococcus mannitoliphagus]NEX22536.1 hypothetical protein [Thiorhodococcus mannitoliphagus]
MMTANTLETRAVVVGLCAHGLALARALAPAGVAVTALEANRSLPGFRTRYADVRHVPDINGPGLVDALLTLVDSRPGTPPPVLFLTNDNMVRILGEHWGRLEGHYQLSWSGCREQTLRLLDKGSLEAHCRQLDLPYPLSTRLDRAEDLDAWLAADAHFPLIVKPTRPLSGFKVRLVEGPAALRGLLSDYPAALPFLLQRWIPGDDGQLLFTALYLDRGRNIASFQGRKLASRPAALGQTTVAEAYPDAAALELTERFFMPLGLSGPVSLEMKRAVDGRLWIIEPTLGRTDYWLDCCVANGIDLPLIEYHHQTGVSSTPVPQRQEIVWFDTERHPLAYAARRLPWLKVLRPQTPGWRARFPYWGHADPLPFMIGLMHLAGNTGRRIWRRARRLVRDLGGQVVSTTDPLRRWQALVRINHGTLRGWVRMLLGQIEAVIGPTTRYRTLDAPSVSRLVFVCLGNINRSAFAQAVARAAGVNCVSVGLSTSTGRPATPFARQVGAEFGYVLDTHRATDFSQFEAHQGDAYIVMELRHAERLARRGIPADRIALLGHWARPRRYHLHDPESLSLDYFRSCFAMILPAVLHLVRELKEQRSPCAGS